MADASRIDCVTRSSGGDIRALAGSDGEGRPWQLSREELVRAIESGRMAFYVTFEGHSHLVTLRLEAGRKQLVTFLGELEALPLAEC